MKNRYSHIKKGIVTSIFLIILGGIIFNSTFFLHAHKTACGQIVFHAHPFSKTADSENSAPTHEHNKFELDHYSSFGYYTFFHEFINLEFRVDTALEILSKPCLNTSKDIYRFFATRGPPNTIS
ncbi:MAG: hypothetical protein JEY96_11605 [Bacteroidales bacterium]|jgi:hypothetical protein|nr:hypothetical protein [Bacteroidales bacterium]